MSSILIPGSANSPDPLSRTVTDIVRANLLTPINAVLAMLAGLVMMAGSPKDALFAGVIIANSGIGIIQELRAKRILDSLRVLTAPLARVRRPHGVDDVIGFIAMVEVGPFRRLFELEIVRGTDLVITLAVVGLASAGLWLVNRVTRRRRRSLMETRAPH